MWQSNRGQYSRRYRRGALAVGLLWRPSVLERVVAWPMESNISKFQTDPSSGSRMAVL